MNLCFPRLALLSVLACSYLVQPTRAQNKDETAPAGQALIHAAAKRLQGYKTILSQMRVRTDLLGQPLVGSGRYAQLDTSNGLLLRMELAIQAGQEVTSIKQISDGRSLWEHWRMGESERVNHIDLQRVARTVSQHPTPLSMSSSSLASGGLPRLAIQLAANFDFDTSDVREGKLGDVEVWALAGMWKSASLAAAAPQAVNGDKIVFSKLPSHLPHQVEVLLGKSDLFPYRVTYQKWDPTDQTKLVPVVTTEFFEVRIDEPLDASQFQYKQPPNNVAVADQTDTYLKSLGIATKPVVTR